MLLTILCTTLFLLSITWFILDRKYDWGTDIGATLLMICLGIWFIINSICLSACPASTRADIKMFEAIRTTINEQRENKTLSEFERVQLTERIIKQNEWLAGEQFWAKNKWLNWYYDIKIMDVSPIK